MMHKTFIAGAAAVLAVLVLGPAAEAGTRIGVTVGEPWPQPSDSPAYPVYDPGYPDDGDDYDDEDYISCGEGRRILRDYGFWNVRPVRCGGEVYRYRAVKRDRLWSVRVSAHSGRIISARVIGDDY